MAELQPAEAPAALPMPGVVTEANGSTPSLDDTLHSIFERNHVTNGAERGEGGKFVSDKPSEDVPAAAKTPSSGEEVSADQGETPEASSPQVSLPPSWQHKADEWGKLTPAAQAVIAEIETSHQRALSDQGRQIAANKPMNDVLKAYEGSYANLKKPNGEPIKSHEAIATLFQAHKELTADPVNKLIQLADTFGARDALSKALGIQATQPPDVQALLREISGLKQAIANNRGPDVEGIVASKLQEHESINANVKVYEDFAKDNPLITEIPQDDLLRFIEFARTKLPDTASSKAVLERAYDMAVNADPTLRVKSAANKPAPVVDDKKAEEAKRAASVNVKSTSTGNGPKPSLDDALHGIWQKNNRR